MRTETRLFLGRTAADGSRYVTDSELDDFLRRAVAPVFSGFTVTYASGYWEGTAEGTAILSIVHDGRSDTFRAIDRIALAYRAAFGQECVLVVSAVVRGRLI